MCCSCCNNFNVEIIHRNSSLVLLCKSLSSVDTRTETTPLNRQDRTVKNINEFIYSTEVGIAQSVRTKLNLR